MPSTLNDLKRLVKTFGGTSSSISDGLTERDYWIAQGANPSLSLHDMKWAYLSALYPQKSLPELEYAHYTAAYSTLTAVFSAWNPIDKDSDVILSGSDRIATITATGSEIGAVRGTQGRAHTDNRYFEVSYADSLAIHLHNSLAGIGLLSASIAQYPGANTQSYGYQPFNNSVYTNNAVALPSYFQPGAALSTVGVDVDFTAGTITFNVAGKFSTASYIGISGTLFPMWGPGTASAGTRAGTLNTGGSAFTFGLPSGASAWGGTWNSSDKDLDVLLSGGDLDATVVSVGTQIGSVRGTQGRSTGRYYFEIAYSGSNSSGAGVGKATATLNNTPGTDVNGWCYYFQDGVTYTNNVGKVLDKKSPIVIGVWINNGSLKYVSEYGTGPLANNINAGTYYPMWGTSTTASAVRSVTLNTGNTAFAYPVPSGATAWG